MNNKLTQQLTSLQTLKITQELKRAFEILSLPISDLAEYYQNEIEKNPLYEVMYPLTQAVEENPNRTPSNPGNFTNLLNQAKCALFSKAEVEVAQILIGYLDRRGFITEPLEDLSQKYSIEIKIMEKVLEIIKNLDPPGSGSKDFQEYFLFQLKDKNEEKSLAFRIIKDHYQDFIHQRYPLLAKKLKISKKKLQEEINNKIKLLSLTPFSTQDLEEPIWALPDISVIEEGGKLEILIHEEGIYPFKLSKKYEELLTSNTVSKEEKFILLKALSSGKWLIKNLQSRKKTLIELTSFLLKKQKHFFTEGKRPTPLTVKETAKTLGVNISTISRTVNNKYIETPFGLYPLRFFFSKTPSKKTITQSSILSNLIKIIENEDKSKPLTDSEICNKLCSSGIQLSRRCVSKYRQKLSISAASKRKNYN